MDGPGTRSLGNASPRYTLADVRRSYGPEKRRSEMEGELPCYLLYRPISFPLALLFLRLRIPALAITLLSGVAALAMLGFAWRGGEQAYLIVAGLGFVAHVLDCTDGNMARTVGRAGNLGRLVDGAVDSLFWSLLFVSVGLLVEQSSTGWLGERGVEFAMGCFILVLLNRQLRDQYALCLNERPEASLPADSPLSLLAVVRMVLVSLEYVYVFAIALGGALGALDVVLLGMGVYVALISTGAVIETLSKAAATDQP